VAHAPVEPNPEPLPAPRTARPESGEVVLEVDGREVRQLFVSFTTAGFLITPDAGTHPVTRVFAFRDQLDRQVVKAGDRNDGVIGPGRISRVELRTHGDQGCWVHTSAGTIFMPINTLHATWGT